MSNRNGWLWWRQERFIDGQSVYIYFCILICVIYVHTRIQPGSLRRGRNPLWKCLLYNKPAETTIRAESHRFSWHVLLRRPSFWCSLGYGLWVKQLTIKFKGENLQYSTTIGKTMVTLVHYGRGHWDIWMMFLGLKHPNCSENTASLPTISVSNPPAACWIMGVEGVWLCWLKFNYQQIGYCNVL